MRGYGQSGRPGHTYLTVGHGNVSTTRRASVVLARAKLAIQAATLPALGDVLAAEAQGQARLGLTADHRDALQVLLA